jgi:hypothetical protein
MEKVKTAIFHLTTGKQYLADLLGIALLKLMAHQVSGTYTSLQLNNQI